MKNFLLSFLFVLSSFAYAGCPELYPNGKQIAVPNTVELCNSFFVTLYDKNNRAVVAVFEKLSKGSTVGSAPRVNAFRSDTRIKNPVSPREYVNSGYDRGHMAPAQDASNSFQMRETFLMSNMTPQEPTLNEQSWKRLEMSVRKDFLKAGRDFYIANIAIYNYPSVYVGSIPVPTGYWKIVYNGDLVSYHFAENKAYASVMSVTYVDVNQLLGITSLD